MQHRIFIKTFGCSLNQSDSELMAGLLKQADFEVIKNIEDADAIIINTCTVKGKTEKNFFRYLAEAKKLKKKIIVAGCIPQTDPEKLAGYPLIGTYAVNRIVEVVEETVHDNTIEILDKENNPRLNLPKIRKNPVIEIIPICAGCLGAPCSYCKVKSARGNLLSYGKHEIIKQANRAVNEGVKEIWLTAQDTGCYGKDASSSLPELLRELIKIPGDFKIRLGMANPNHVKEFLDELIQVYQSDKIFKFIHIPVQSGSDKILEAMKRKYTAQDFRGIISRFRQAIPEITIATDIICGLPGETDEDFQKSLDLTREIKPDVLNISRFWPRPKTEAEQMENQVHSRITKDRSRILTQIFHNIARMRNECWFSWQGEVLVDERGKDNTLIARNYAYKPVVIRGDYRLGDKLNVRIRSITPFDLRAEIKQNL
jgi:threonylcarbamoyladenosine tRNA methylthiotransferase CDKAL1